MNDMVLTFCSIAVIIATLCLIGTTYRDVSSFKDYSNGLGRKQKGEKEMSSYLYWSGVVFNVIIVGTFLFAVGCSIYQWFEDLREERYFRGKRNTRIGSYGADKSSGTEAGGNNKQS